MYCLSSYLCIIPKGAYQVFCVTFWAVEEDAEAMETIVFSGSGSERPTIASVSSLASADKILVL